LASLKEGESRVHQSAVFAAQRRVLWTGAS
jgi:hypothetical protein